ncbi:MAG TPA: uracil-DNA glycosylase family protein, partial [Miltoncostaeaceae bacterium]|nr:uracil-DNA glycosylase family protein [Miltoncostaeaceae bacterium]
MATLPRPAIASGGAPDAAADPLAGCRAEVASCTRCGLHAGRRAPVWGEGPAQADLMLVGEAPGYREDRDGRPFRGATADLL